MALKFNFYHEQHREEYERARDPLKLAGKGAVALLLIAALYYVYRLQTVSQISKEAARLRAQWVKLEPSKKQAEAREAELLKGQQTHKAVVERLQKRFLFAPLLAQLQAAIDPGVQLQLLSVDRGREEEAQSINIQLIGVAAGLQPRRAAEEFRLRLFNTLSDEYEKVSVRYDGTNSLEETNDTIESEDGVLGVAKFRLRVALGAPKEPAPDQKSEEQDEASREPSTPPAEKQLSLPAKKIAEARETLEGVAKARQAIEDEVEGKEKPSAADVARQKEKR